MENPEENTKSNDDNESIDPIYDITSIHFDPIRAIYNNQILSSRKVKVYDNISSFEAKLKNAGSFEKKFDIKIKKKKDVPEQSVASTSTDLRRFLPHQLPVPTTKNKPKLSRNILAKMELTDEGPISLLKNFKDEKQRVKILTRKEKGIRGYITGYIEAFDKHWNIALVDVFEKWKRRKYAFSPDSRCYGTPRDMTDHLKWLNVKIPEIKVKSLNRKYVECMRFVPQLMIRGEQVVLITLDNTN